MLESRPDTMERITNEEQANAYIQDQIAKMQAQIGDKKVLLALSGGVDSSVVAALLIKAVGQQLVDFLERVSLSRLLKFLERNLELILFM